MVSRDDALVDPLTMTLVRQNPETEIQVVSDLADLMHVAPLRPDVYVLDLAQAPPDAVATFFTQGEGGHVPTVVVQSDTVAFERELLDRYAAAVISRRGDFVGRSVRAVQRTRRVAELSTRADENQAHYHSILESSSDGIFVLEDGAFTFVNASFSRTLGYDSNMLLNAVRLEDLVPPNEQRAVQQALGRVSAAGDAHELFELTLQGRDVRVTLETSWRVSVVNGTPVIVGVARDVTELRAMQLELERARQRAAQVERMRALGELAAGVAHDFNNTLGTILGRLELAQEKLGRGVNITEELHVIEKAAHNAASVVQRIQEFSRPQEESWEDVDLCAAVQDAAQFVQTRIPEDVTFSVHAEPTPTIRGNGQELREVLLNLLTNAIDAVGPGGTIQIRSGEEDGAAVVVVEDDGEGMSPEVQRRIFEPFFTTKAHRGTGLGLAVSHWILRRHDARIQLQSESGRGTTFKLSFTTFAPAARAPRTRTHDMLSVLVVDDDATVGDLVSDLLTDQGHQVHVVSRPEDAVARLRAQEFDLVITDLDLPGMSGWQLARELRQIRPELLVGLISGWPLRTSEAEMRERGVDFWLSKPFSIEALQNALATAYETARD